MSENEPRADASLPDRVEAARWTDEELARLAGICSDENRDVTLTTPEMRELVTELQERRAADACEAERRCSASISGNCLDLTEGFNSCPIGECNREREGEAERNSNTTDEYEQVGWCWPNPRFDGMWFFMTFDGAPPPPRNGLRPVYARRAVSSEDVHREATE